MSLQMCMLVLVSETKEYLVLSEVFIAHAKTNIIKSKLTFYIHSQMECGFSHL